MSRRLFTLLFIALVAALAIAAAFGAFAAESEPTHTREIGTASLPVAEEEVAASDMDYARLDQRLQALVGKRPMVGLAVAVVERGKLRFARGYGVVEAGSDEKVTPDTVFRWASVSKGVAATMVAKLAEQGKLSLEQPVSSLNTTLRLPQGAERVATVRDLLSHRLGLYRNAYDNKLEEGQSAKSLRGQLAELNLVCKPGSCWSYQNVSYDASSEMVESLTGKSYGEALRDQLFGPLGMDSASVTRAGLQDAKSWARGHNAASRPIEVNDVYYGVPAAGGVNSDIKDMAQWMRAQMGEMPDVLSHATLDEIHQPLVFTPSEVGRMRKYGYVKDPRYGLGFRVYKYREHRLVGHRGGVNGYRSLILFDPDLNSGVVALWNSNTSRPTGLQFEVMDMLYGLPAEDWLDLEKD